MIHKNLTRNQGDPVYQKGEIIRKVVLPLFFLFLFVAELPSQAYSAGPTYPISPDVQTTRQRTVSPVPIPDDPLPHLTIDKVDQYGPRGDSYEHTLRKY